MAIVTVPNKEIVKEIEDGAKSFFGIVQRFLRLSSDQKTQGEAIKRQAAEIKAQAAEIAALRDELHTWKAREKIVIVRAESAATLAASNSIADLARCIGRLEARHGDNERPRRG